MGLRPNTPRLRNRKDKCGGKADFRRKFPDHEKNRVKLLSKRNLIAFFEANNLLAFCLLTRGEGVTQVTDEGLINPFKY